MNKETIEKKVKGKKERLVKAEKRVDDLKKSLVELEKKLG